MLTRCPPTRHPISRTRRCSPTRRSVAQRCRPTISRCAPGSTPTSSVTRTRWMTLGCCSASRSARRTALSLPTSSREWCSSTHSRRSPRRSSTCRTRSSGTGPTSPPRAIRTAAAPPPPRDGHGTRKGTRRSRSSYRMTRHRNPPTPSPPSTTARSGPRSPDRNDRGRREMAILCDTATVPLRDSAELWVEAVSELFVPLECVPHDGAVFDGRLSAGTIGPIRMCVMVVSPHTVKRTPRLAANTQGDQYKLSLILGGEALIVQDAREAVLRPGDFAIYDCSRPYTFVNNDPVRMLVCLLPRDIIGVSPTRVSEITATRIPSGKGIGWAMAPFLKRLALLA